MVLGFRTADLGSIELGSVCFALALLRSGAVAVNSAVLKLECHNVGTTERPRDGTSREMGGALAPPFEHLVYIYMYIYVA